MKIIVRKNCMLTPRQDRQLHPNYLNYEKYDKYIGKYHMSRAPSTHATGDFALTYQ